MTFNNLEELIKGINEETPLEELSVLTLFKILGSSSRFDITYNQKTNLINVNINNNELTIDAEGEIPFEQKLAAAILHVSKLKPKVVKAYETQLTNTIENEVKLILAKN